MASEVVAARLIRTNSPDNDDDSIVGMWKTSLKRTRHKSSYPFSIWESHCLVQREVELRVESVVEIVVPVGSFVIVITMIVSRWEIQRRLCVRACDAVNMQVYF